MKKDATHFIEVYGFTDGICSYTASMRPISLLDIHLLSTLRAGGETVAVFFIRLKPKPKQ